MSGTRMESAVRRTAAASLTAYRRAARNPQDGQDWATMAASLAQSVDLLLGVLCDDDGRLGLAWDAISDLRARTEKNTRQLNGLVTVARAAGADMAADVAPAQQGRPRLTLLPGGSAG